MISHSLGKVWLIGDRLANGASSNERLNENARFAIITAKYTEPGLRLFSFYALLRNVSGSWVPE